MSETEYSRTEVVEALCYFANPVFNANYLHLHGGRFIERVSQMVANGDGTPFGVAQIHFKVLLHMGYIEKHHTINASSIIEILWTEDAHDEMKRLWDIKNL